MWAVIHKCVYYHIQFKGSLISAWWLSTLHLTVWPDVQSLTTVASSPLELSFTHPCMTPSLFILLCSRLYCFLSQCFLSPSSFLYFLFLMGGFSFLKGSGLLLDNKQLNWKLPLGKFQHISGIPRQLALSRFLHYIFFIAGNWRQQAVYEFGRRLAVQDAECAPFVSGPLTDCILCCLCLSACFSFTFAERDKNETPKTLCFSSLVAY